MEGYPMDKNGKTMDRPAVLDKNLKLKTRILNKPRRNHLRFFGWVQRLPLAGPVIAQVTRRVIGSQLHAVKLEVNSYCNQQCRTCYIQKEERDLALDTIRQIADDIKGYHINVEIIGGEPLLREDIADIVEIAKVSGASPRVSLYTNGTLATEQICSQLKTAGLDSAVVTLHAHTAEKHDGITGTKGSWEKTICGINNFIDNGIKVYTATVVHRENYEDIKKICSFAEEKLGASAIFTKYIPESAGDTFSLTSKEWREVRRWLIHEKKVSHMFEVESFFALTGSCPSGNYVVAVKADGTVQPCPFATGITMGKVPDKTLWQIYENRFKNPRFVALKKIPNQCLPCVLKDVCGGGCRSSSYGVYDGICGKDPLCGGPYSKVPKGESVMDLLPIHY
jgi:radical SAM protein with 4Fe4S-binding SPASM domain